MSKKNSKTIDRSMDETKEYHVRYLNAINNPLRRKILRALSVGSATIKKLQSETGLASEVLEWHLNILEYGFCVEKEIKDGKIFYRLTKEGRVVDYLDK